MQSSEAYLLTALKCGLFRHIYLSIKKQRWLKQYLRWRLVSRRFNQFILRYDGDSFTRTMFNMQCNLTFVERVGPDVVTWSSGLFSPLQVIDTIRPIFDWGSLCQYNSCYKAMLDCIGEKRVILETHYWRIARPRIRRTLAVRPAEMDPHEFMAACSMRARQRLIYVPESRTPKALTLTDPARCGQCWNITRKRLACQLYEVEHSTDVVVEHGRPVFEQFLCGPCIQYRASLREMALPAVRKLIKLGNNSRESHDGIDYERIVKKMN